MKIAILLLMEAAALRKFPGYLWYHEFDKLNFYSITGKEYTGPF